VSDFGWPLPDGYRVVPFDAHDQEAAAGVLDLWAREEVMPVEVARQRIDQVVVAATDAAGNVVGVSTAFLQRSEQLRMNMWHMRGYTARAERRSAVGVWMGLVGRDHLQEQFTSGRDKRAAGMIYEVENAQLRAIDAAHWLPLDFLFIGVNEKGAHVRVHYFPGAVAP
jgi:hypothetical protein